MDILKYTDNSSAMAKDDVDIFTVKKSIFVSMGHVEEMACYQIGEQVELLENDTHGIQSTELPYAYRRLTKRRDS